LLTHSFPPRTPTFSLLASILASILASTYWLFSISARMRSIICSIFIVWRYKYPPQSPTQLGDESNPTSDTSCEREGDFNCNTSTIRFLRRIPNAQVTLMSGITWGL
jgi:hypothetical protein